MPKTKVGSNQYERQMAVRTPYRYLEEIRSLTQKTSTSKPESEPEYYPFQIALWSSAEKRVQISKWAVANKLLVLSHIAYFRHLFSFVLEFERYDVV